jgi:hypothetical protein
MLQAWGRKDKHTLFRCLTHEEKPLCKPSHRRENNITPKLDLRWDGRKWIKFIWLRV